MTTRVFLWGFVGLVGSAIAGGEVLAQAHDPDPTASRALSDLVAGYRSRPALTIRTTVAIELSQDGVESDSREVESEFVTGPRGVGIVKLRGFTCFLGGGRLVATHESTDHSYYSTPDDDSPYYALMTEFLDIPFPHLAIAFGEDDLGDLCMQLHQKAPWIQPTAADTVTEDGRTLGRIVMTSDFDELTMLYDRDTKLIESIVLKITGGDLVQPGATLTYRHTYEYETHDDPMPAETFAFVPGERQRVDLMGALVAAPPAGQPRAGGGGGGGDFVGKPAPDFTLATSDGDAIDLEQLRGQVVVLDFWATWCGPCRQALPLMHEVAKWVANEDVPARILTVNVWERGTPDERLDKVKKFWQQQGYTLPVAMDYTDQVAKDYGLSGIPTTVIIRADGVVHARHVGVPPDTVRFMRDEIAHALDAIEPDE